MNPFQYYVDAFQNYANFRGRADRSTFWYYHLINFIIVFVLGFLSAGSLSMIYGLIVIIPGLSLGARRLHDIGKSGWWQLLYLIPIIGFLILVIFFILSSQEFDNEYGEVNA